MHCKNRDPGLSFADCSDILHRYESVEASATAGIEVPLPSEWTSSQVRDWLMVHATAVNSESPVNADVDLFEQGFDRCVRCSLDSRSRLFTAPKSLSATFLRNRITGSLKGSPIENTRDVAFRVSLNVVFSNPTLTVLANHLVNLVTGKANTADPKAEIERMIEKYSSGLQGNILRDPATRDGNEGHIILITGSTGGLGSYLLASLLNRKDIIRIYALNRRSKTTATEQRQRSGFEDRGLDISLLASQRLVYVDGDTSQEQLDLDRNLYEEVKSSFLYILVLVADYFRLCWFCVTDSQFCDCDNPQRLAVGLQFIPIDVRAECSRNSTSYRSRAGVEEDCQTAVHVHVINYICTSVGQGWRSDSRGSQVGREPGGWWWIW